MWLQTASERRRADRVTASGSVRVVVRSSWHRCLFDPATALPFTAPTQPPSALCPLSVWAGRRVVSAVVWCGRQILKEATQKSRWEKETAEARPLQDACLFAAMSEPSAHQPLQRDMKNYLCPFPRVVACRCWPRGDSVRPSRFAAHPWPTALSRLHLCLCLFV